MNTPTVADEITWRSVAPKKRMLPVIIRDDAAAPIPASCIRNKVFSTAAKPRAVVIIYITGSSGSLFSLLPRDVMRADVYLKISSVIETIVNATTPSEK